jgi:catechol 2,3-dioxygenase-like lactoylglutathione lyase family enzyme
MPVDHIGITVTDLERAKTYYDALMPALAYEEFFSAADEFSYRPVEQKPGTFVFFYPGAERAAAPQHVAFMVKSRAEVDAAYDLAVRLGSEPVHHPQLFPQYHPAYYAAFWLDPFDITLEVVCHKQPPG